MSIARKIGNVADVLDSAATGDFFAKGSSDGQFQNIAYSSVVGTPGSIDSAATTALIDSAYIQARQTSGGAAGLDSATTINLIDSSYVAARSGGTSGFDIFTYTATAGQTVFQDSSSDGTILNYQENGTLVYYNGLLLANEDYTETSNDVITLAEGADSGAVISIATWDISGSETWSSVASAIANSQYTSALITTNGTAGGNATFTDGSSNSRTISVTGNTANSSFSPYRHGGYSANFDGSDTLTTTGNAIGSGDFTVEAWIKPSSFADYRTIFTSRTSGNSTSNIVLAVNSSGNVYLYSDAFIITSSSTLTANTWYHVAVVRNGTGANTTKMYIDGSEVGSTQFTNNLTDTGYNVAGDSVDSYNFVGHITDVRVTKSAVYTSAFTPPTQRLTSIANTEYLNVNLPYIRDLTVNGDPSLEPVSPYANDEFSAATNTGSVRFDGSGDYLSATTTALGTGDWTVEYWVYHNDFSANQIHAAWGSYAPAFYYRSSSGRFAFYSGTANSINSVTPVAKQWYHIAWVHDDSANTIKAYVNGKLEDTITSFTTNLSGTSLRIGDDTTSAWMHGNIADFRVTNTTVYTSEFTPPTSPLTNITGTNILVTGNEAKIIDKSQSTPEIKLVDNATSSSTQKKFAATSMYFDGTLDEITTDGANIANFGTGDFTVEAWIYPQALSGYNPVVADNQYVSSSPTNAWCLYLHGTTVDPWKSGSSILDGGTLSTNTWQHIAWTRESGTMRIFIDGSLVDTATDTTSFDHGDIIIGANVGNYHYEGYIEDLRITKGLARYTAAFTPPASSLQG